MKDPMSAECTNAIDLPLCGHKPIDMAILKGLDEFLEIFQGSFKPRQYSTAFVDLSDEIRYLRFRNPRNPASKIRLLTHDTSGFHPCMKICVVVLGHRRKFRR